MKQKFVELYMDWAERAAQMSHAKRLQVGAVIVKDDTVISYGYNGMPSGWDNNCEDKIWLDPDAKFQQSTIEEQYPYEARSDEDNTVIGRYGLRTKPEVLHAESNAIAKLAKSHNSGVGADLFVTHSPCIDCAKLILQSGVGRVYFGAHYRDDAGIKFLRQSGITVEQIEKGQ